MTTYMDNLAEYAIT